MVEISTRPKELVSTAVTCPDASTEIDLNALPAVYVIVLVPNEEAGCV